MARTRQTSRMGSGGPPPLHMQEQSPSSPPSSPSSPTTPAVTPPTRTVSLEVVVQPEHNVTRPETNRQQQQPSQPEANPDLSALMQRMREMQSMVSKLAGYQLSDMQHRLSESAQRRKTQSNIPDVASSLPDQGMKPQSNILDVAPSLINESPRNIISDNVSLTQDQLVTDTPSQMERSANLTVTIKANQEKASNKKASTRLLPTDNPNVLTYKR